MDRNGQECIVGSSNPPTKWSTFMSRHTHSLALALALAAVATACGSSTQDTASSTTSQPTATDPVTTSPVTTSPVVTSSPTTEPVATTIERAPSRTDSFESADCAQVTNDVIVEELFDDTVECGYVSVPADWNDPEGGEIQIATYRIPSVSDSPAADPVVYLEGGPGGAGVLAVGEFATGEPSYLRERADVIVIDQRGTGYSVPALFCPETGGDDSDVDGNRACHDRLVADGVEVSDYNSAYNARDLDAVRQALGYDEWNLYGLSYGTRLALTAMRDTPVGLRSVILDSVFPPQINGISEAPYTMYWAIDQIAANCEADADCVADVRVLVEEGLVRLQSNPVGDLDGEDYLAFLGESIASPEVIGIVTTVAIGTDSEIAALVEAVAADDEQSDLPPIDQADPTFYPLVADAVGMAYGVVCSEEEPYLNITAGPTLGSEFGPITREVVEGASAPFDSSLCPIWNVNAAGEIETQAVSSGIPTLILAGTADVTTPPAWSRLAGDTLSDSTYVEFPGLTHGLLGDNNCLNDLTAAFLDNPLDDVDQTCVAAFPAVDYESS